MKGQTQEQVSGVSLLAVMGNCKNLAESCRQQLARADSPSNIEYFRFDISFFI